MKVWLSFIPLAFSLSILLFPSVRLFFDGFLAKLDVQVSGGEQKGYLYWLFLIGSIMLVVFVNQKTLIPLRPFIPYLIASISIFLLAAWNLLVAMLYYIGFAGLCLTFNFRGTRNPKLSVMIGITLLFLLFFVLEVLLGVSI